MSKAGSTRYFDFAPTDRAMTVLHGESRFVPQLELDFNAVLDDGRLGRALELLARRHPILQATVDSAGPRAAWRPGTTAPVFVHAMGEAQLDPRVGPTCRLVHLRDATRSRLQFGVHHAVADGRGLAVLLDDLRALYVASANDVDVDWTDRTIAALLETNRVGSADRVRMGWDAATRWAASARSTHRDGGVSADRDETAESAGGATTRFDRTAVAAIRHAGPANGWRPNHVFLAVLARAWLDVVGHEPTTPSVSGWLVTVDVRRPFGVSRGVGNLSGLEPVSVVGLELLSRHETVDAVRRAFVPLARPGAGMVADLASPGSGIAPEPLLDRAIGSTFAARAAISRYTRFYSHLDRLPDSLADWGDAEVLGLRWCANPPSAPPYVACMLATLRDTTTLTVIASPLALASDRSRALANRATETFGDFADAMSASRTG